MKELINETRRYFRILLDGYLMPQAAKELAEKDHASLFEHMREKIREVYPLEQVAADPGGNTNLKYHKSRLAVI